MDFQKLISDLPSKARRYPHSGKRLTGSAHIHPSPRGYDRGTRSLRSWGVKRGTRVGIHAPNSYQWLVHDLALLDIGAVSVAFTEDFDGRLDDAVLGKYGVSLC